MYIVYHQQFGIKASQQVIRWHNVIKDRKHKTLLSFARTIKHAWSCAAKTKLVFKACYEFSTAHWTLKGMMSLLEYWQTHCVQIHHLMISSVRRARTYVCMLPFRLFSFTLLCSLFCSITSLHSCNYRREEQLHCVVYAQFINTHFRVTYLI